jgi:hypothetical protein
LPVYALPLWVEDFKPDNLRQSLDWSASYHPVHNQASLLQAIATEYPRTRLRVPAVVALFDAEGLTMDLGLIVAARQHQMIVPRLSSYRLRSSLTRSSFMRPALSFSISN